MPQVPDYGGLKEGQTVGPDVPFAQASGPNAGEIGAQQVSQAGAAISGAGKTAVDVGNDQLDIANQVKVNDAMNQARAAAQTLTYDPQVGYQNLKGDAALTRPSGVSLPEEYSQKLGEQVSNISGTLGNDVQRRMFQQQASGLQSAFTGSVEQHMLGEFQNFRVSTADGTLALTSDAAKRAWNDPVAINGGVGPDGQPVPGQIQAAKAAVYDKGKALGWSAAQIDAATLAATSNVHTSVVMSALDNNNPAYAMGYLNQYKGAMSADDILRVQGHVNQSLWLNQAAAAVQAATTNASLAPTSNFGQMVNITAQSESGSKDFNADGSTVQGPVVPGQGTAKGSMQVMDATALNPGHGIAPANLSGTPQQQAAERTRVGTQLLQALLQKYGDPAKAWAAYNAGEANVDKALSAAAGSTQTDFGYGRRQDGSLKGQGFLGPQQRPDGSVSTEITIGVNINGKETEIPTLVPTLSDAEKTSLLNGDKPSPAIVQKAVDFAKSRIAAGQSVFADNAPPASGMPWLDALAKYQSPENHAQTVSYVQKNVAQLGTGAGMAPRPTELDFVNSALAALPPGASPQVMQMTREHASQQFNIINKSYAEQGQQALGAVQNWLVNQTRSGVNVTLSDVPPALMDQVMRYAPGDAKNLELFSKSIQRGDVITNPGRYTDIVTNMPQYAKLSDPAWNQIAQTELSPSDGRMLSKERASYINQSADNSPQSLNTPAINQALKERMEALQLPVTVPATDMAGRAQLGGTQQFVRNTLLQQQQAEGKKFTPAEINDHLDKLFATDVTFKNTFLGFPTGSTVTPLMSINKVGDLPDGAADQIRARLAKEGNKAPTDMDVVNRYRSVRAFAAQATNGP